jgi:transcriptional regulator with GAF, ATPase, and Fis domain
VIRDTLGTVAQALAGCVSFEEFFDAVHDALTPFIPHDAMGIYTYDARKQQFRPLIVDVRDELPGAVEKIFALPPEKTLKARAIRENRSFRIDDTAAADYAEAPLLHGIGLHSHMVVPLVSRFQPLGVLYAVHRDPGIYDDFHLALLTELAAPVAVALEEVRELTTSRALQHVGEVMAATLDIPELFLKVSERLQPVLPHTIACIFAVDEESGELGRVPLVRSTIPGFPLPAKDCRDLPGEMVDQALHRETPVLIPNLALYIARHESYAGLIEAGIQSCMACRLEVAGRPYGLLFMGDRRHEAYTRTDMENFLWVSRQLSLAVAHSIAFKEVEQLSRQLQEENIYLKEEVAAKSNLGEIISASPALQNVLEQAEMVASADITVLITGETGTGKELIARAIHELGPRAGKSMIRVNCAALPRDLIESELFGHERGSFTGAERRHIGRFELAHGGTLFLDEVGDMPLETQARLLRALQEGEFERVGGESLIRVDVRVVAATNQDLQRAVSQGTFREDLYYRLMVFPIHIPPLRERVEDIIPLARHFALRAAERLKKPVRRLTRESQSEMLRYSWPGNVRELEHMIERGMILARTDALDLVPLIRAEARLSSRSGRHSFPTLEEAEREHILSALEETGWKISGKGGTAELLGVPRTTLQARMRKLGIGRNGRR